MTEPKFLLQEVLDNTLDWEIDLGLFIERYPDSSDVPQAKDIMDRLRRLRKAIEANESELVNQLIGELGRKKP